MKRQILCCKCTSDYSDIVSSLNSNPEVIATGEKSKFLVGNSKSECICDTCGKKIFINDACCAVSTFTDARPYFGWEEKHINPV